MLMDETIARITTLRPKYVFLTAKSGAGKTFFSNQLTGYKVLELDRMVRKLGVDLGMEEIRVFQVYKNLVSERVAKAFVERIHDFFEQNNGGPIVVEGAIADASIVKRVFSGLYSEFTFVYLYPVGEDAYVVRMMKRFKQDKENNKRSLAIWPFVTAEVEAAPDDSPELKQFMVQMARWSMDRSEERYQHFQKNGLDMIRVEV